MMKIAFVLDDSLDRTDGVQQHVLTLGRWLSSNGHDVYYLTGQTKRKDIPNTHSLSRNVQVRFNRNKLSTPIVANTSAIRSLLNDNKFDIIHVQMPFSPVLAGRIVKLAPDTTTVVGTFHVLPYGYHEKLATKLLTGVTARSNRRIDAVASVSRAAALYAKTNLGIDSEIIPNMIDVKQFKNPPVDPTKERVRIVYLGRLVKRKGPYQLLRAVAAIPHEHLNSIEVILAGNGSMKRNLQKFAQKSKISHVVHFPGFVAEKKKASLFGSADIAVFPSISGESFGIVLIEAMASGAGVVIGGDNPGYRSVLGTLPETLFDPKDTPAFADILVEMITNSAAKSNIRFEQARLARQYDVNVVAPKVLDFYRKAIDKHNSLYNR